MGKLFHSLVRACGPTASFVLVAALSSQVTTVWASDERTVLVLHSDPALVPATAAFTEGLREGTRLAQLHFEAQYLDISQYVTETDELAFAQWLQVRYQRRQIPIVVALARPASDFAIKFAATIWPHARIVHAAIDGDQLGAVARRGDPFVLRVYDYRRTVEAALALVPGVRQLSLVGGASVTDRRWLDQAEANLAPLRDRIRITRLANLSWDEVLERVGHLPEDAIALPVSFFGDADNRTFVSAEAVLEIARFANRPVFVNNQPWIGSGAIGGFVMDPSGLGRQTARVVLGLLNRQDLVTDKTAGVAARWIFDAGQLRRWRISERDLPAGSDVVNREPSLWRQYRWYVVAALSLVVLQTLLIGGLLIQRTRRRRAERSVRTNEAALRMSYERIRQLAGRLIGAQETARTRIARDLHDDVGQQLASLSMAVAELKDSHGNIRDSPTQQVLAALQGRTLDLVQGVRRLSHDLHPATLRHVGLAAALESHCIEVEQRYDVQVSFDSDAAVRELRGDIAVALFRIAQESLRNAAIHGNARRVALSMTRPADSVELVVADDGAGFDREEIRRRGEGLGLVSIEERARLVGGDLLVITAPGQGTTIRARVPWHAAAASAEAPEDVAVMTSTL